MTTGIRALLIAGPTAAGKSAIALRLAQELGGAVINADSMQIYREWRILTARPTDHECQTVPHLMYGHVSVREHYSVGKWLRELQNTLPRLEAEGLFPIVVGGTGAYFRALTEGLAEMPSVEPAVRRDVESWIEDAGLPAVAQRLAEQDPDTAAIIDLQNPRRVARAWEVRKQTGRGLAEWRSSTPSPLLPKGATVRFVIAPSRECLRDRISRRFDRMMTEGALREARDVLALRANKRLPGMRPVGAPQLFKCIEGVLNEAEAVELAKTATRQFAKRQMTWFRNRMPDWNWTNEAAANQAADWILGLSVLPERYSP